MWVSVALFGESGYHIKIDGKLELPPDGTEWWWTEQLGGLFDSDVRRWVDTLCE